MEYTEGVAKGYIRLMNADHCEAGKVTLCHEEMHLEAFCRSLCQIWINHFLSILGKLLHRAIKRFNAVIKCHTSPDDRAAPCDKSKFSGEIIKQVF